MLSSIKLKKADLVYLESYKVSGRLSLRQYKRLNILLLLHKGKKVGEIADFLDVARITVWRIRNRYVTGGIKKALEEDPRPGQPLKYTTDHQSELAALACSPCPQGRRRWTVRLLAEALKKKQGFGSISRESVRIALKKMIVSPG